MGRLTEYFGFINVPPKELNPMWIENHMTRLNVHSVELIELRAENLRFLRENKKEAEKKRIEEIAQQTFFDDVL